MHLCAVAFMANNKCLEVIGFVYKTLAATGYHSSWIIFQRCTCTSEKNTEKAEVVVTWLLHYDRYMNSTNDYHFSVMP